MNVNTPEPFIPNHKRSFGASVESAENHNETMVDVERDEEVDVEDNGGKEVVYDKDVMVRTTVGAEHRYKTEDWPQISKTIPRAVPQMRNAAASDIKDIVTLANDLCLSKALQREEKKQEKKHGKLHLLHHKRDKADAMLTSSGFFLSHMTEAEYTEYMSSAEHFLVLHMAGKLVGFILAYSSDLIDADDPREEIDVHIKLNLAGPDKPFVLVKQLVVDPQYKHCGFPELLYMEVYARVVHWHADDSTPFSVYTEIVAANQSLVDFHRSVGYPVEQGVRFTPQRHGAASFRTEPRLLLANHRAMDSLSALAKSFAGDSTLDTRAVYDASSMIDPHCVGVGLCLYWIEPPDPSGTFYADVRIMMKWRHPGIEETYPHPRLSGPGVARTPIDISDLRAIRAPRYAFNEFNTETTQHYAYIDKHDPPDVITMQQVMRGKFIGKALDLGDFPADTQYLEFKFRMWDNDPDDRCRYFRQLYYADNTPWQLVVKRVVEVPTCSFLAAESHIGTDQVAGTSYLSVRIPCVRNTGYYLRTVAVPLFFIASLTICSIGLDGISPRIELNTVLLLTNVAYLFVTKDETPKTAHVTKLDMVTYMCFLAPWCLIVLNYAAFRANMSITLADNISYAISGGVVGFVGFMIVFMRVKYVWTIRDSPALGEYDFEKH